MTKQEHVAAWAARQADQVARQIMDLPKAMDWRSRQRKARTICRLHAEEARLRRLARPRADDVEGLPF